MPELSRTLTNPTGLHARPAKVFAATAASVDYEVRLVKGEREVNAASVLSVLTLDCNEGDEITIRVPGEDPEDMLGRLCELIDSGLAAAEDSA